MRSAMKALCAASVVLGATFAAPHAAIAQGKSHKAEKEQVKRDQQPVQRDEQQVEHQQKQVEHQQKQVEHQQKQVTRQRQTNNRYGTRYSRTRNLLCDDGTWTSSSVGCANHGGVAARQVTPRASEQGILHANEHSAVARAYANRTAARAIARCQDGTYWHATTRTDACVNHGGVRRWL